MADNEDGRTRISGRIPDETYNRLCSELSAFSTDTARVQFLVQYYFEQKEKERGMSQARSPAKSSVPSEAASQTDDAESE